MADRSSSRCPVRVLAEATPRRMAPATRWGTLATGTAIGAAVGGYALYAGVAWLRYGHPSRATGHQQDSLLDRFIPDYDVVERHHIRVSAPAAITLEAAQDQDLFESPIVRVIIKAREIALRAGAERHRLPRGLLAAVTSLGWGVLAEVPGREIVVGAVTKPWEADVAFHSLPPDRFGSFAEPGFVKMAWTLRADPVDRESSIFRTETRAVATDPVARARFRRYWAFASPGIAAIRWLSLRPLRRDAERRAAAAGSRARSGRTRRSEVRVQLGLDPGDPAAKEILQQRDLGSV